MARDSVDLSVLDRVDPDVISYLPIFFQQVYKALTRLRAEAYER